MPLLLKIVKKKKKKSRTEKKKEKKREEKWSMVTRPPQLGTTQPRPLADNQHRD
jgi:hypothetical protein